MHSFRDNQGRTWVVAITVAAAKRARATLGLDLLALVDDGFKPLEALLRDPVRFVDLLYVLCRDQAETAGVTDERFGEGMGGDAIDAAAGAFVEALVDFFPTPDVRDALRRTIRKARDVRERLIAHGLAEVEAIDPDEEAAAIVAAARERAKARTAAAAATGGGSSGSAPASSA